MPTLDQEQSYSLLSLTETDGQTTMRFERSIKSCDTDDHPITELPVKLIYAYGQTDQIGYHRQLRGTKEVNLLKYMPRSIPTQSQYFDLTMLNFTVPPADTRYECRVLNAPTFAEKQHIYRIQPLIDHPDVVHHLLLYKCLPHVNETFQEQCYTNPKHGACFQIMAAWGVGGGDFEVPEHVGIPIGGDEGDCMYRLEIHYNNPMMIEGRVDNSGLRLHYTSQLRKHDAGTLQAGLAVAPGYSIPPNTTSFHTYGVCDLSANTKDMQVFATGLHTHLAGRKVRVGHFREDKQIGFLAFDDHYDFEFQEIKNLGKIKTLKMGDSLVVECTYDTSNRTGLTWGGLSTQEEMCLVFVLYYPASNISNCVSFPDIEALKTKLGASTDNELYMTLSQKTWDEEAVIEYERTLKNIPQDLMVDDGENMHWNRIDKISDLMESPTPSCDRTPPRPGPSNASNMARVSWILLLLIWVVMRAF
ncbi:DBH-like monooxygenase protein 2 homolog isoform X2 [Sardina pilchardus]